MSSALYDSVARIARHEVNTRATAGVGRVVDIHPADGALPDHAVTVKMRDSGLVLPRVPVAVGVMGFAAIPAVDDLVVVLYLEGDYNAPVVVGRDLQDLHSRPSLASSPIRHSPSCAPASRSPLWATSTSARKTSCKTRPQPAGSLPRTFNPRCAPSWRR